MPRWTDEQYEAITSQGENIIVSAGAGSGKTAVLTERVITKLKQGVTLDQLLVLTFTNAAAGEMKERVRKAILKDETLAPALDMIDAAYITTFDSFALAIVRKYHDLLNMKATVGIIDASWIALQKKVLLEMIMEEEYQRGSEDFSSLIHDFVLKDDQSIKTAILEISQKLDLLYDKESYLDHYIMNKYQPEQITQDVKQYQSLLFQHRDEIATLLLELSGYVTAEYEQKMRDCLSSLLTSDTYDKLKLALDLRLPNLPRGSEEEAKQIKSLLAAQIKELKQLCHYQDEAEIKTGIMLTKPYATALVRIIQTLDQRLTSLKQQFDLYEFTDIAKLAIKLVTDYPDVQAELRTSFHEILVDEYQDTSDLQEMFITAISNHNIYMVGDIKQSIYRFRNANPDIFKQKYNAYREHQDGKKIDLNKNFRSRNTVLEDINQIFNRIMDDKVGGAMYQKEHQLVFGNTAYLKQGASDQNMHLEIYDYRFDPEGPYHKEEIEAFMIAHDIKQKMEQHYQIFDKDQGFLRDITYEDFAILADKKKHFALYKKIFTFLGIPLEINKESVLTESLLIIILKNLLIMVAAEEWDAQVLHAYMSVARSPLGMETDQQLFHRITKKDFTDDPIYHQVKRIHDQLDGYTNRTLLKELVDTFSIYSHLIEFGDIEENLYRLDYLFELADTLANQGYDVRKFITYLQQIFAEGMEIKYDSKLDSGNAVKIMSIHKSKGLEFYVCYFPEMYGKFVLQDLKGRFYFEQPYGIITPYYQEGIHRTIYTDLLKEDYLREAISEKLRVFYVALTRAKEKMIILCDLSKESPTSHPGQLVKERTRLGYRSFQDILVSIKDALTDYIVPYDMTSLELTKDYQRPGSIEQASIQDTKAKLEIHEPVFAKDSTITETAYSHQALSIHSYEEKLLLEAGNYFHYLLETIDLKHPQLSQLPVSEVHKEKLYQFLNQPLLDDIQNAKVYQEYEFLYEEGLERKHGVIDLLLVYDDHAVIIDYKLKNIEHDYYIAQLKGYREYIKHITKRPVKIYLYSILNGTMREIEEVQYVSE